MKRTKISEKIDRSTQTSDQHTEGCGGRRNQQPPLPLPSEHLTQKTSLFQEEHNLSFRTKLAKVPVFAVRRVRQLTCITVKIYQQNKCGRRVKKLSVLEKKTRGIANGEFQILLVHPSHFEEMVFFISKWETNTKKAQ